jgi:metal-sulfur cluster biosynthetic enzyme
MGLVREVAVEKGDGGTRIAVSLAVTHPMCMMSAVFVNEARIRLGELDGVGDVHIHLDTSIIWTDDDFSPDYAARRNASLHERGLIPISQQEHSHA